MKRRERVTQASIWKKELSRNEELELRTQGSPFKEQYGSQCGYSKVREENGTGGA